MLNALREGTKHSILMKIVVFGFLLMGLGGLVFMDIGGFFRGGLGNTTLARVGDQTINIYDFQRYAARQARAQNMTVEEAHQLGFTDMLLEARIGQIMLNQAADDMGIVISQEQVEETLGRVLDSYRQDGQSRQEVLQSLLQSQSLTQDALIEQTKTQLKSSLIRNILVASSLLVPNPTAEALRRFQSEQRSIETFYLAPDNVDYRTDPNEAELQEMYEREKDRFLVAEKRTVQMIKMTTDLFDEAADVQEDELRALYEERIEEYATDERRHLRQAIVKDMAQAQDILQRARESGDLEQATISVTGSDAAFRKETYFNKDGLLDALADPVFNAEDAGFLDLQQSALGWHVIELTKVEAPRTQSFDEVKSQIEREATQERTDIMLIDLLERAENRMAAGDNIQQIADNLELEVIKVEELQNTAQSSTQKLALHDIPETDALMSEIFALEQNMVSDAIEIDLDGFVMVEVTQIQPQSYEPFEDVKDEVRDLWVQQQKANALRQKAASLAFLINSGEEGRDMQAIANEHDARLRRFEGVRRDGDIPEGLHADVILQAFASPQINQAQQLKDPDGEGYIIFRVDSASYPDDAEMTDTLSVQKRQFVMPLESATQELYYQYLRRTQDVQINDGLMDTFFGARENPASSMAM